MKVMTRLKIPLPAVAVLLLTGAVLATAILIVAADAQAGLSRTAFAGRAERRSAPAYRAASELLAPDLQRVAAVGDIRHIKEVQSYLKVLPTPIVPELVYYIGDSTARESVVSEAKLAAKVLAVSDVRTQAYVLVSSNQTFPMDQVIADGLPADPALVLIGVGLSRFTNQPAVAPTLGEPLDPVTELSPWAQHKYSASSVLTATRKRAMVKEWMAKRYPLFEKNEPAELAELDKLVQACTDRGWTIALVEMPLNTAIIKHAFDVPRAKFRADCKALAARHEIAYLPFRPAAVGLTTSNFYDLIHLVGNGTTGGRTKWQASLAAQIDPLLTASQP